MKQKFFTFLCLCILCIGSAWGEIANPYSFTFAKGELTTSSTSYTSGEVTWSMSATENNWNGTSGQLGYLFGSASSTKTLTISTNDILGTITEVSVTGRSNNKGKTAAVSVKVGTTNFTSETTTWNNGNNQTLTFNGSASGEIAVTFTPDACGYVLSGISVKYTASSDPSISASNVDLAADATSGEIAYTISNPVEGKSLTAETSTEWISNVTVDAANSKVTFNTTANTGAQREGTITLKYDGATDKNITVTQKKGIPTFATLEDLVAADLTSGDVVKVSFENAQITGMGSTYIYLDVQKGGKNIEIYVKSVNIPSSWNAKVGGSVSGTLTCPWTLYSGTWELCPTSWDGITYTAPKEISSIEIGGTATKTVYTEGEFFNDYSGLTVTATFTDNTTDDVTGLVTWSVNPSTALTTDVKSVTVTASINEVTDDAVVNITVNPEPTNFVWDLTIDETTTATASEISWVNAIANIKAGGSETDANNYYPGTPNKSYTSTRFYKGATFTISPKNGHEISSIVLDATTDGYATTAAGTWKNASASKKGLKVTVTPTDGSADVSITLTNTVGLYSIKVYYTIPTEYTRTVTAGNFGTICLPYDGTVEGATLYSIAGKEMNGEAVKNLVLNEEGDELMGGMPYVFKATAGTLTVSYDSNDTDAEDATDIEGLYGTYDAIAKLPDNGTVYVISQNKFWCVNSPVSCAANRAYIVLSEVKDASAANNLIIGNGNLADGINAVVVAPADSKMYNLNGQAVGADYKGIVIMNGKKMFNK